MKLITTFTLFFFIMLYAGGATPTLYAVDNSSTTGATTENNEIMHPRVLLQDDTGKPVTDASGKISYTRTCGACHDANYINSHNTHFDEKGKVDCVFCHFKEGRMDGDYNAAHLRIQMPGNENCAICHGIVQIHDEPLSIPDDYTRRVSFWEWEKYYELTQHTGEILSWQDISLSFLNLKNKSDLHLPWDIHARRQLLCISCHNIANDPLNGVTVQKSLGHLVRDPRKIKSPGEILKRPDHNLKVSKCTSCHDPFAVHPNLPYKKRHMDVLSCQACHVPNIYGPAFQSVDQTVLTAEGTSPIEFRGGDETQSHGTTVNTRFLTGYQPFLFPFKTEENTYKISPYNLVTYWFWRSQKTGQTVPADILKKVYFSESTDTSAPLQYAPDVLTVFDSNKNQKLEPAELRLDNPEKITLMKAKLTAAGIAEPVVAGKIEAFKINHNVVEALHMKRECTSCHGSNSRLANSVVLAEFAPMDILPEFSPDTRALINGTVKLDLAKRVILKRTSAVAGHYILGLGRMRLLDTIALWIFLLSVFAVCLHALGRYIAGRKQPTPHLQTESVYMYRFYERLWHWTMVLAILLLALTGIEIHYAGHFSLFGLATAVSLHTILAVILVINAALSFFYHLTTGEIKQFFRFNRKFLHEVLVQLYYYIKGIFSGVPHPIAKTVERKLNPLQQLTYIILLNLLLPFQILTGLLMWGAEKWSFVSQYLGGLTYLGPIHNFGSWLFLTFIVVHVYLTTTGHTVFSNIRAMITGYDEVTPDEPHEEHQRMMDMKITDLIGTIMSKLTKTEQPKPSREDQHE